MRVLVIGSHKRWRLEACVARAFQRAGHETRLLDDRRIRRRLGSALSQRWMLARADRFRPDFVFLSKGIGLDLETARRILRGRASAIWYQDPPYFRFIHRPDVAHVAAIAKMCDAFFVTGYVKEWRRLGMPARYLPAAADRDIRPVPPRSDFDADVGFIGTGYDDERARFLIALSARVSVRVWGTQWERWRKELRWERRAVEGRDFAAVCSSSRIVLGVLPHIAHDATDYASDRMWLTALAGGFYLGARSAGTDRLLLDGVHCAWYDNLDSCVWQVRQYLRDAAERERVRAQGERYVRAHHTFDQRIPLLLRGEPYPSEAEAVGLVESRSA